MNNMEELIHEMELNRRNDAAQRYINRTERRRIRRRIRIAYTVCFSVIFAWAVFLCVAVCR